MDIDELSKRGRSAAMRGGTDGWGAHGSVDHARYSEPVEPRSRRRCHCGCKRRATHKGMANGVCLTQACELGIARWVKTGLVRILRRPDDHVSR
jgi:hypothetical protein